MRKRIAVITLVGLVAALGILLAGSVPMLPERVATHFGADGLPNGWTARESFVATMALIVVLPVAFMQGIGLVVGRLPPSLINLPNRDYWLAGERRPHTIERLRVAMLELGNATLAFLIFVVWSVIDANRAAEARLGGAFKYGLFAFLAFTALWTFFLVRPYLKVPKAT
jgi:hypothetical protein